MRLTLNTWNRAVTVGVFAILLTGLMVTPAPAHHSFAMYDPTALKTFTGRLTKFIGGSNHAQIFFNVVGPDGKPVLENGKPVQWGIEMASAAQLAKMGLTIDVLKYDLVLATSLHPLRDGRHFGAIGQDGELILCGNDMPAGGCTATTGKVYI